MRRIILSSVAYLAEPYFSEKILREFQNILFSTISSDNCVFYEIIWKNMVYHIFFQIIS